MRYIAIGLAAATIAIGGSALGVSALYGQESSTGKGSMSGSVSLRAATSPSSPRSSASV
jgi:hypothetical protein